VSETKDDRKFLCYFVQMTDTSQQVKTKTKIDVTNNG